MDKEHALDGSDDAAGSPTPMPPADEDGHDGRRERGRAGGRGFYSDALTALLAMKDDFGRQLELASERQNAMVQSIGIILAFASILMGEAVRLMHTNPWNVYDAVSMAAMLACCMTGIATIWEWKSWRLYTGSDTDSVIDAFNSWRFIDLHHLLVGGVLKSHDAMAHNNYILRRRISLMVLFLLAGTVSTVTGMVI